MAMTVVCVHSRQEDGTVHLSLFASNEYLPYKERDSYGNVLPNQEWQHPDPATLRYNELGTLSHSERVSQLLQSIVALGTGQMGGHIRVIEATDKTIIQGRLQSWADRSKFEETERGRELRERESEELRSQRLFEYCPRCGTETEACQSPMHRGQTRCTTCGGGIADVTNRHCVNCLDIPWREQREKHTGAPIIYGTEDPTEL
jgi:hypothetical protein